MLNITDDLRQMDLSFITRKETRRMAEEAIAILARTEQHLSQALQVMRQVNEQLAMIALANAPQVTIGSGTQRQLSWMQILEEESWLTRDRSEEAVLRRFEEYWNA